MSNYKKYKIDGIEICITNHNEHFVVQELVLQELNNGGYSFSNVSWGGGKDTKIEENVLDLGGNCGILAIYLALKYPFLKIYSFEADPRTFEIYQENLKLNNLENHTNLQAFNLAVTSDGNDIFIDDSSFHHSGGNSVSKIDTNNLGIKVKSITLDNIIKEQKIKKIKYFKIDIEGSEFEVIYKSELFKKINIEYFGGEFHGNKEQNIELFNYVKQYVEEKNMFVEIFDVNSVVRPLMSKIVTKYLKACYNNDFLRKFNFYVVLKILAVGLRTLQKFKIL